MTRDSRRLPKELRQLPHVTGLQVLYASTILAHTGIEAALKGLAEKMSPMLPLEAAEAIWHEEIQEGSPCQS